MRRRHLRMHCQRIEINLGALAGLSLVAIIVLSSKKERRGFGRLRIARGMSNKDLGPCKIRVNSPIQA